MAEKRLVLVSVLLSIALFAGLVGLALFFFLDGLFSSEPEPGKDTAESMQSGPKNNYRIFTPTPQNDQPVEEAPPVEPEPEIPEWMEEYPNPGHLGSATGRVVLPDGTPVEGALVRAYKADSTSYYGEPMEVLTDSAGTYRIGSLYCAWDWDITAEYEGYRASRVESVFVRVNEVVTMPDIVLTRGSSVTGLVLSESGASLSGVRVVLSATRSSVSIRNLQPGSGNPTTFTPEGEDLLPNRVEISQTRTAGDGSFGFSLLERGRYFVEVKADGYCKAFQIVDLDEESRREVTFFLTPEEFGTTIITGFVSSSDGLPVGGARVTARGEEDFEDEAFTDSTGLFKLNVTVGEYDLLVSASGFQEQHVLAVPAGQQGVEVCLEPAGMLIITVVDKLTGEPLREFRIGFVILEDGALPAEYGASATIEVEDPQGTYSGQAHRTGAYAVYVSAEGYGLHGPFRMDVRPGVENSYIVELEGE